MSETISYTMVPVGEIVKTPSGNRLEIFSEYRSGLCELANYSHLHVLWWAHEFDDGLNRLVLETDIPYAEKATRAGVFACRSPQRPNPVMMSVCRMTGIDEDRGKIYIGKIDAHPGSRIVDLKPYIPCVDRVRRAKVPKWFPPAWGEWLPEHGIE